MAKVVLTANSERQESGGENNRGNNSDGQVTSLCTIKLLSSGKRQASHTYNNTRLTGDLVNKIFERSCREPPEFTHTRERIATLDLNLRIKEHQ